MQKMEVFVLNYLPTKVSLLLTKWYFRMLTFNQHGPHRNEKIHNFKQMDVKVLPALKDNYMYLIIDNETKEAAVVDPVEPNTVLEAVKSLKVNLISILTTHHHWDHSGGNEKLKHLMPNLVVYGGDSRITALNRKVNHDTRIKIGRLNVQCLHTPCHTTGHICYYVTSSDDEETDRAVFTGDTLLMAGCGRFFEGTAELMYKSLTILGTLPNETKVFCGHEYTFENLIYAAYVEPENEVVVKKIEWAQELRNQKIPTVPSTIGDEKMYNPFMRVDQAAVQQHVSKVDPIITMDALRREKDYFKYNKPRLVY